MEKSKEINTAIYYGMALQKTHTGLINYIKLENTNIFIIV